ncbi:unnamed protein product [Thlaspi arvense]|uniref:Uncharacterized protein n=1 Tax=Thlaspi arvense TaxID=13288 RepID=A0AAU9RZX4_THLAR|nr:unnamed protein product [Thlaspi arvense]
MTSVRPGLHEFNLASRRAEEAAARRFQAVEWLQSVVGQLGIPSQPSEKEFISCLRNGMILCNAINKIHPGAVSKVVENYSHLQSFNREYQPPQAYQYFENVRNFLVALEQLRLPGFEASDLEKDNLESGSVSKVVDCVLGLKAYHECKITSSGNGFYKHIKTPTFQLSATKIHPLSASKASRHLDRNDLADGESDQLKVIAKLFADHIFNSKENIDENLSSLENGSENSRANFQKIISRFPELQSVFQKFLNEGTPKPSDLKSMPLEESAVNEEDQSSRSLLHQKKCNHKRLLKTQEKELALLKTLFIKTKQDFKEFQVHLQRDLMELGNQMQEMSSAAQGYYKVVEENRKLYNMVQDLKGNIRVYCRVRPIFNGEMKGVIDYIGKDGCLFVVDPSKPLKDARKTFQFNQVFGPTATQGDVFRETQPLIRSVMDGYNVCIFAYGQTGSGKTYTMSGPPGRSATEMGINYLALSDLFLICDKRKDMMTEDDGLSLPDATMHSVNSTKDVLQLMEADTSGGTLRSCLHLVDLAGSERVDKSEVTGDRLKEAQYINKSLSCLGDVISALAQKNSHIPYRNSKLTLLLQDSLGGQAKTLMFAHLSPEEDSFGETISTLKFAQRASTVELGAARAQKETREVMHLKEQIENLKKALGTTEWNNVSYSGAKEVKSPLSRPMATTERTPPRLRRLSIENCSNTKANLDDRKGIKSPLASRRAKRLSLEGPKSCKNEGQGKGDITIEVNQLKNPRSPLSTYQNRAVKGDPTMEVNQLKNPRSPLSAYQNRAVKVDGRTTSIPQFRRLSIENCSNTKENLEDRKGIKSPLATRRAKRLSLEGKSDPTMEVNQLKNQRSPLSSYQNRAVRGDGRTSIPQLQVLQTPDKGASRNEIQFISVDSRTSGKGSNIRKSLRTIGKLINGRGGSEPVVLPEPMPRPNIF